MLRALKGGIDETEALCVGMAVSTVHVVTAILQGSIDLRPAEIYPRQYRVEGVWGSFDVNYAIYEELLHPYLRPAADTHYPGLPKRIAKRLA